MEDVTRLMELLHRTPLEPHCGQEAVRAAATGRPVEELVQLIGRLAEDGRVRPTVPTRGTCGRPWTATARTRHRSRPPVRPDWPVCSRRATAGDAKAAAPPARPAGTRP